MNKIKLLYDVITTMKEKENLTGTVRVEAEKARQRLLVFSSEFEKNVPAGRLKAKFSSETDCDGNKVKHESTTEFNLKDGHRNFHHGLMKHMHGHEQRIHAHGRPGAQCCGMNGMLNKLVFALYMLNNLQAEEKGEAGYALTLDLKELPEELRKAMQEKKQAMEQNAGAERTEPFGGHGHFGFMKELHTMENPKIKADIAVNKRFEIEKVLLSVTGEKKAESGETVEMSIRAELNLAW